MTGVPTEMAQQGGRRLASRIATHRVFDPLRGDGLKARALKGSAWTIAGFGSSQVLRLGSNLVLTRLLFPEAFGLMALVSVFMQGLAMFSDVGIGPSIIQNKRGEEPAFLNTAWTIQIVRGFILWAGAWALAWPVASFYGEPLLMQMLPVVGLTAAIQGFQSTAVFTSNRRLDLGRLTMLQLVGQAVSIAVMVTWAAIEPTVWALVAGGIASSIVQVGLGHVVLASHRHRIGWDRQASRSLFRFGKWIFLGTAITFIGQQADRLFLGRAVGAAELGVYSIAVMIVAVPIAVNMTLIRRVGYPVLSEKHRSTGDVRAALERIRRMTDLSLLAPIGLVIPLAPAGVALLYDERYHAAGAMVSVLLVRAAMRVMLEPIESALVAIGRPRYATVQYAARTVGVVVAMPFAWQLYGLDGIVWVIGLSEVPSLVVLWRAAMSNGLFRLGRELRSLGLLAFAAVLGWSIAGLIHAA